MIVGAALTEKSTHDAEVVPELLDQIEDSAERYIADGAYDTKATYGSIEAHSSNAKIVISPRENAIDSVLWHSLNKFTATKMPKSYRVA